MDKKRADGRRTHFSKTVTTTPVLLVGEDSRWIVVINNQGPAAVLLGVSGTIRAGLAVNQMLTDEYSINEWWAATTGSTALVSGYYIR